MTRWWAPLALGLALALGASVAVAATETVLLVDNSGSMVRSSTIQGTADEVPPADPDRLSVLATLLLQRIQDPGDRLHILNFAEGAPGFAVLPNDPAAIREMDQNAQTHMRAPLAEARRILAASTAQRRLLILMTDGEPTDDPRLEVAEARALLGLDAPPVPWDVVVIGLAAAPELVSRQDRFLVPLVGDDGTFVRVARPEELVDRFTEAYAAQLGSKPESGRLSPGASYTVDVGKYVREVIVLTAGAERVGPYAVRLERDGQDKPLAAGFAGDNGCTARYAPQPSNPQLCKPPFHHWTVWKEPNDPRRASRWRLSLDRGARSDVAFGFILRYDLGAELVGPPGTARVGEPFEVVARMTWEGRTFDEAAFFDRDGFEAVAILDGQEVPLARRPDHTFAADVRGQALGPRPLEVVFRNRWMQLPAQTTVVIEGYLPLTLMPGALDFGAWRGEAGAVEQCRSLTISGENAARVPLDLVVQRLPDGARLRVGGGDVAPGDVAQLPAGATEVEVCLISARCCDDIDGADVGLALRGRDPHYAAGAVPITARAHVEATGFYRCWRLVIWAVLGALGIAAILWGLLSPHDFEPDTRLRVAGSEQKLQRATAMVLREQPGGRRGFYRDATVGLDAGGGMVGVRTTAWLRLRARGGGEIEVGSGASLETKDRRTRAWQAVSHEAGPAPLRRRVDYRVGELYFRIE